jgi:hypothetical protein
MLFKITELTVPYLLEVTIYLFEENLTSTVIPDTASLLSELIASSKADASSLVVVYGPPVS